VLIPVSSKGPQAGGRVGEVRFPDEDVHSGVMLAEGDGEAGAGLLDAVDEGPDGDRGGAGGGGDPGA